MKSSVDYIIVGQGLAGTVLAHTLVQQQKKIIIIDSGEPLNSSKVAAGLYNPLVFKRLVKSWMADELLPAMNTFYGQMEVLLHEKLYFKKQIVKLFAEEQEKKLWQKKCTEEVGKYMSSIIDENFLIDTIYNPLGAAEVIEAGNLYVTGFLDASKKYFTENKFYLQEPFDYNAIRFDSQKVIYKGIEARKIIFCEGFNALSNPYFSWLPFKLTKGEVLTVKIPDLFAGKASEVTKVINKGVFILSLGNDLYKVGATYEWQDLSPLPTEKGKSFLITQLQKVIKLPFEIIDHQAGIRPTVIDRRPLIGIHPEHPELAIFNGLGTKGVMLAPYFANHFAEFLDNKISLNKEIDIARF